MQTTTNTTGTIYGEVHAPFGEFTGVPALLAIYRYHITQYEQAKILGHFGYASKCAAKAELTAKRLNRYGATDFYLAEVRNEAINEALATV
jgi:hypothetical protein